MKKLLLLIFLAAISFSLKAQVPVNWTFTAVKTADKTYELHFTADIQNGWHLYSQTQPEDAIVDPTAFKINSNPLITVTGKPKEMGKMEKFHDAKLDISANQYAGKVDFVQVVKLKANAKTSITGNVLFQTCNDVRCLPPKTIPFTIALK